MKKYGLQLKVQPQQKKQPTRPPLPPPIGFNDEDEDNVEREILRQAYKNKSHRDIEEQHKKALEEDPSVFDYDGVYDKMKEKQVRPVEQDRQNRKPRYIQALMDKTKQREKEHEIIYERKLAKERSKDEDLYADKDKFVTSAYKKKLAEQAKWLEEERLRELKEEKDDVTKKTDISDFYFNLDKNVAFGASEKHRRRKEETVQPSYVRATTAESSANQEKKRYEEKDDVDVDENDHQSTTHTYKGLLSDSPNREVAMTTSEDTSATSNHQSQKKSHQKRSSEDTVAAAKARFLARKNAKLLSHQ